MTIPLWQREEEYRAAEREVFFRMFPTYVRKNPVCSYQCGCGHRMGWIEFADGVQPKNYKCGKCNCKVELVFSHYEKRMDHTYIGHQARQDALKRFYASEEYAAFRVRYGPLYRIEPDIEDEP